jgi:uncharacterized protein YukE
MDEDIEKIQYGKICDIPIKFKTPDNAADANESAATEDDDIENGNGTKEFVPDYTNLSDQEATETKTLWNRIKAEEDTEKHVEKRAAVLKESEEILKQVQKVKQAEEEIWDRCRGQLPKQNKDTCDRLEKVTSTLVESIEDLMRDLKLTRVTNQKKDADKIRKQAVNETRLLVTNKHLPGIRKMVAAKWQGKTLALKAESLVKRWKEEDAVTEDKDGAGAADDTTKDTRDATLEKEITEGRQEIEAAIDEARDTLQTRKQDTKKRRRNGVYEKWTRQERRKNIANSLKPSDKSMLVQGKAHSDVQVAMQNVALEGEPGDTPVPTVKLPGVIGTAIQRAEEEVNRLNRMENQIRRFML